MLMCYKKFDENGESNCGHCREKEDCVDLYPEMTPEEKEERKEARIKARIQRFWQ